MTTNTTYEFIGSDSGAYNIAIAPGIVFVRRDIWQMYGFRIMQWLETYVGEDGYTIHFPQYKQLPVQLRVTERDDKSFTPQELTTWLKLVAEEIL